LQCTRASSSAAPSRSTTTPGRLQSREDVVAGIEKFPEALLMLFKGENTGKLLLEVARTERAPGRSVRRHRHIGREPTLGAKCTVSRGCPVRPGFTTTGTR
jgi:anti-sigma factor ChrR (cupin superfamily)